MSNEQEPDGWILFDNEENKYAVKYIEDYVVKTTYGRRDVMPKGFSYKPVCFSSPQELTRLRKLEVWAKEAHSALNDGGSNWDVESLIGDYTTITAPMEGKS